MTSYKEAYQVANNVDKKLLAVDFHPRNIVYILHEEGTTFIYRSAFLREWKDWVFIFTEHHGTHVYHNTDLSFYGHFKQEKTEKQKDTGYEDKCMFCGKTDKVENLCYGHEEFNNWKVLCPDCKDLESADNRELWIALNQRGAWNKEKQEQEPWGFVWGKPDLEHLRKCIATIIPESEVDQWLDTPSEAFPETPRKLIINEEDFEPIYLLMYQTGMGEFIC